MEVLLCKFLNAVSQLCVNCLTEGVSLHCSCHLGQIGLDQSEC